MIRSVARPVLIRSLSASVVIEAAYDSREEASVLIAGLYKTVSRKTRGVHISQGKQIVGYSM
jgi:hypothetical protein